MNRTLKQGGVGLVLSFALGMIVAAVAWAGQVRDPENDQWFCEKSGFSTCWFAKGNPCPDAGGSHPSTGSQQSVCGWVADSCGCQEAYKEVPDATATPTHTPTPTQAPAPPPPGDGDGGGDAPPTTPPTASTPAVPVQRQPTQIQDGCYTSLEELLVAITWEEGRRAVIWAVEEGILEISEGNPFCPDGLLWPDELARYVLALPKYRDEVPLRESLDHFLDVSDPMIDLYKSLGFYPDEAKRPEPRFLLCSSYLPYRHFCPKGAVTQNPVDREEYFTVAWWTVVGPNTAPPPVIEEFLERYPDMRAYLDSAPYMAAAVDELGYFEGIGPSRFCPRTTNVLDCNMRLLPALVGLYRGHADS